MTYALEAQAKQKDSVKLRWLVGGAYLFKADFTKERQYYEASIREYKCAIELAKAGKDKDFSDGNLETIRFYLEKAKDGLSNLKGKVQAMLGAGFSNCRDEWWHYSWGDAGWAVRMGETECCYGLVDLPREQYAEQERLWLEAMERRENPFTARE